VKLAVSAALTAWELDSFAQMWVAGELRDQWEGQ
jgi:hypothetical protein